MISECGSGHGRGLDFGGRGYGFVGGVRGSYRGRRVPLRKDLDNAGTVDAVITSPRSAGKFLVDLSGHNYLSLILLLRVWDYSSTSSTLSESSTVVLTQGGV